MDVGSGLSEGEAWRYMGRLLKDSKTTAHGTPDDRVVVEFDRDVPRLYHVALVPYANGNEVGGYVEPECGRALKRRVAVRRGLPWSRWTGYSPLHLFTRFDDRWRSSPPSAASSPSPPSDSRKRGGRLPLLFVDRRIAVGELDDASPLLG